MAISTYVGAEINPANNTFETWLNRTNDIIGDMGTLVISVGDDNTGNVFIDGVFSANTIYTGTELRGGDANGAAAFQITSNVEFTGANTTISSGEIQLSGNVDINGVTKELNISTIKTTISSANTIIEGFTQFGDSVTIEGDITANGELSGITNITASGDLILSGDLTVSGNTVFTGEVEFSSNVQAFAVPVGNTDLRPDPAAAGMLRFNTELEEFEGYDGTNWGLIGGGGTGNPTIITSNHSAVEGEFLFVNTSANTYTITLPSSPDAGDIIKVAGKNWSVNSVLINRNGETIEGFADDLELDIEDSSVEFIYDGSTWQVFTNVISTAGGGSGLGEPIIVAANYGASSGQFIYADCSNSSFTVTLPATPDTGDIVKLVGTNWSVNNLTVARNGETIEDTAEDLTVDIDDVTLELIYDGSTWQIFTNISSGTTFVIDAAGNTEYNITMTTEAANGVFTVVSIDTDFTFNPDNNTLSIPNLSVSNTISANAGTYTTLSTDTITSTNADITTIVAEDITANTVTANDFNTLSDAVAKDNISSISNVVETLMNLNPVEFTWKKNGNKSYGVIAQELENVLPELVTQGKDNKYVNYIPLIALLLEGYKDLVKKIESLENK